MAPVITPHMTWITPVRINMSIQWSQRPLNLRSTAMGFQGGNRTGNASRTRAYRTVEMACVMQAKIVYHVRLIVGRRVLLAPQSR